MSFDGNLVTIADYEHYCRQITSPAWYEFEFGEHGDANWSTYTSNRAALNALKLRPRVLTGSGEPRLATELLGQPLSLPVVLGPTGLLRADVDPAGEPATARAARNAGTLLVLSSIPTFSQAEVAAEAGGWWQQVFLYRDRAITEWQVENAVGLGATAIVLTVSCTAPSYHQTLRFTPPTAAGEASQVPPSFADYPGPTVLDYAEIARQYDPTIGWDDVDWLRSLTDLPMVVKGIQTAEDAQLCRERGVDAIVVSNHGGRYAQGVRGTIEALPEIVAAVDGRVEVYLDGGVRQGQDVLKALALGAKSVWIGRAARWGQTVGGQGGVERVLEILREELRDMMVLCGVADVGDADASLVTADATPTLEG